MSVLISPHPHQHLLLPDFKKFFFLIYYSFLAVPGFSCGMRTLSCGMHVGSSSLTRGRTWAPCTGSVESYPLDHQGSPLSDFLILAIVVGVKWYCIIVLICISLMTTHVEYVFMCFLAICVSSLGKYIFSSFSLKIFFIF